MSNLEAVIEQRLHIARHPLVKSKITMLRDKTTGNREFRDLVDEITSLLTYIATRYLPIVPQQVETPVGTADGWMCEQKFGIVPILRAGLGMVESVSRLLPTAKIGHIGMYRNPDTLHPVDYYCKLPPEIEEREILLVDPLVATGLTASRGIEYLKKAKAKQIKLLCLIAAPEGIRQILSHHPDVDIYTGAYDEQGLNDRGYIVPGLGDAGDRIFGTR
ncbi:MAG: uracil phosphoribosyltransferase [Defluviitaleaceae bacterium]|nr:uracil phosphoribosyltransferase [Defluviitaleaceae bacterium]MCL2240204.1 uracil phosphoribosyltransferase [Defluviitaleaceae bacterium]